MARPRLRVETVPHACDKSLRLICHRRADSLVWEAEITLPDGSKKNVSPCETELATARFAVLEMKAEVIGKFEQTGTLPFASSLDPTCRRSRMPPRPFLQDTL
jgi:hypothetical protein